MVLTLAACGASSARQNALELTAIMDIRSIQGPNAILLAIRSIRGQPV